MKSSPSSSLTHGNTDLLFLQLLLLITLLKSIPNMMACPVYPFYRTVH